MNTPLYNFRIAPEAIWLIVNTVIGTVLVEVLAGFMNAQSFSDLGDIKAWGLGLAFGAVRTLLGAILAAATGGSFVKPGEKPTTPTTG